MDRESQHRLGRQQEAMSGLGRNYRSNAHHVRHLRSHGSLSGPLNYIKSHYIISNYLYFTNIVTTPLIRPGNLAVSRAPK